MTKKEYLQFHTDCMEKMKAITRAKNADYTGIGDNPFANFTQTEAVAGVTTEQGFLVRMGDKMARIKSFVQKGVLQVKDESVEDTLLDLANYCVLMAGFIRSKRDANTPTALTETSVGIDYGISYNVADGGVLVVKSSPARSN